MYTVDAGIHYMTRIWHVVKIPCQISTVDAEYAGKLESDSDPARATLKPEPAHCQAGAEAGGPAAAAAAGDRGMTSPFLSSKSQLTMIQEFIQTIGLGHQNVERRMGRG